MPPIIAKTLFQSFSGNERIEKSSYPIRNYIGMEQYSNFNVPLLSVAVGH